MWELIRLNKRKSIILFGVMGSVLVALGYLIGQSFAPPEGGYLGVIIALSIWLFMSALSYFKGDSILLKMHGAKEATRESHQQLYNVVEEMKIAAGLPKMPKVYVVDTAAMNAFATGRDPENCAVAITTGLLEKLNRDELQGVIAHEMSHIDNRDVLFMTFAGILLGSIVIISEVYIRSLFFARGSSRRSSSSRGGGQAQAIIMVAAVLFAILAPILAQLLFLAISRKREYLADASAARLTRYPEGLASALEKISGSKEEMPNATKVTAPMYISPPFKKTGKKLKALTSTHPPVEERIRILRSMAGGAGYLNYQAAFEKVRGSKSDLIPKSGLESADPVPIRQQTESA